MGDRGNTSRKVGVLDGAAVRADRILLCLTYHPAAAFELDLAALVKLPSMSACNADRVTALAPKGQACAVV